MPTRNSQLAGSEAPIELERISGVHLIANDQTPPFSADEEAFFEDASYLEKYEQELTGATDLAEYVQGENKEDGIRNFTRAGRKQTIETATKLRAAALEGLSAEELKLINATKESPRNMGSVGKIASKVRQAVTEMKLPGWFRKGAAIAAVFGATVVGAVGLQKGCGDNGGNGSGPTSASTTKGANDKDAGTDAQAKDAGTDIADAGTAPSSDIDGGNTKIEAVNPGAHTPETSSVAAAPSASPSAAKSTSPTSKTATKSVPAAKFGTVDKPHSSASTAPAPAKVASAVSHGASSRNVGSSRPGPKPESTGQLSANAPSPTYYKSRYYNQPRAAQKNVEPVAQATEPPKPGAAYYNFSKNRSHTAHPNAGLQATKHSQPPFVGKPKAQHTTDQQAVDAAMSKTQRGYYETGFYQPLERAAKAVLSHKSSTPKEIENAKFLEEKVKYARDNHNQGGGVTESPAEYARSLFSTAARYGYHPEGGKFKTPSELADKDQKIKDLANAEMAKRAEQAANPRSSTMSALRDAVSTGIGRVTTAVEGNSTQAKADAKAQVPFPKINVPAANTYPTNFYASQDKERAQAQATAAAIAKAPVATNSVAPKAPTATGAAESNNIATTTPTLHTRHKLSGDHLPNPTSATSTPSSFGASEGNFTTDTQTSTTGTGSTTKSGESKPTKAESSFYTDQWSSRNDDSSMKNVSERVGQDPYSNLKSQIEERIRSGKLSAQTSVTVTADDGTRLTATVTKYSGTDQFKITWTKAK